MVPWTVMARGRRCENSEEIVPEECLVELKKSHMSSLLVSTNTESLVDCSKFTSLGDLVRVMSFVYMFICVTLSPTGKENHCR